MFVSFYRSSSTEFMHAVARINLLTICAFLAGACAPQAMRSGEPSPPLSDLRSALTAGNREAAFADRIQTKTIDRITVSACILPDAEALQFVLESLLFRFRIESLALSAPLSRHPGIARASI